MKTPLVLLHWRFRRRELCRTERGRRLVDETHRWAGYVEGHSYKEASVLTLGQKTGLFQFSGPGQAKKLLYKNDPQCTRLGPL